MRSMRSARRIAFTPAQIARVFDAARAARLAGEAARRAVFRPRGAALAAAFGALSADHLEYARRRRRAAMAQAGTVAVLLPGAFYMLRETQPPPVDALRRHGVPIAIATDSIRARRR